MDKSLAEALSLLESHVSNPRGHAAVKTLRNELEVGNTPSRPAPPQSPGQKAAQRSAPGGSFDRNSSKLAAGMRMKAGK